MHNLLASYIGSLSYASLPHVDTFHYTISKTTCSDITINFMRKIYVLGNYQAQGGGYEFSKILICVYYWQQILSFVFH